MTSSDNVERLARIAMLQLRQRFEIWAPDNGFENIERFDPTDLESKYKNFSTQAAFEGWCGAMIDDAIQRDKGK
jgi:hypothetical protein